MILFLYGQNSYGIGQKLNELARGYKAKNPSGLNFTVFDFAEKKPEVFFEAAKSDSLIPEKKLMILKNIFSAGIDQEKFLEFFKSRNLKEREDLILIITAFGEPEKNKLFEYLEKKPSQSQDFKSLKNYEIKNWIKRFAASLNVDFTNEAVDFLMANCGSDLWRLDNEIRKLADFSASGEKIKNVVSKSQAEDLIIPNADYKIFALTDALAKKDKKKALKTLHEALENGEKPTELLGLLAWQVRNLLRFKSNPEKPSELRLHPFVLEKTREAAKLFSIEELGAILSKIIDLDFALKTGSVNEKAALSILIAEL
ncbi:DNA polymerase III subunit delta [Candidatus Azambacteria bacterium]|nr:DNA polymerase III subunit delta [Candidatus Azambacteria bacterium]